MRDEEKTTLGRPDEPERAVSGETDEQAMPEPALMVDALFETSPDAMFLLDEERTVLLANPRAESLFAREGRSLEGLDVVTLLAAEHRNPFSTAHVTLDDGEIWSARLTAQRPDGLDLPVRALLQRLDADGQCVYHLALRDLTDRTRLERGLERRNREVEGMNLALRSVVRSADEAVSLARRELVEQLRRELLPVLERMAGEPSQDLRRSYLELLRDRLDALSENDPESLSPPLLRLTPRELEICRLIRLGRSGMEIADLLGASFETIQTHRKNIRRKLGLRGRRTSLATFLQSQRGLD